MLAAALVRPHTGPEDPEAVSSPREIRQVSAQLQDGARALGDLVGLLPDVRLAIRSGRLRPEEGRIGSMNGFQADWSAHLDDLRGRLDEAHDRAESVAQRLRQLDEEGAAEVRQAGRAAD